VSGFATLSRGVAISVMIKCTYIQELLDMRTKTVHMLIGQ